MAEKELTPAQKQRALLRESEADIAKLCTGLTAIHEAIATMAARAEAAGLSRDALVAATVYALAKVPLPPIVSGVGPVGEPIQTPARVSVWTQQFTGDNASVARAERVQRILNNGQTLEIPGVSPEQIAQDLLAGKDPRKALPKAAPVAAPTAVSKDLAGWYGFRGSDRSVAPSIP